MMRWTTTIPDRVLLAILLMTLSARGSLGAEERVAAPPMPLRDWTILVYAAGDEKTVHESTRQNLQQLERIPALRGNTRVNVIVQHDDLGKDPNYRYELNAAELATPGSTLSQKPWRLQTPPLEEAAIRHIDPDFHYGERNSGDPRTLKRFLSWAVRAYPASHYALVLAGHSWGLQGHAQDFFFDGATHKLSAIIKNYELRRVMEELYREQRPAIPEGIFDVLMIDACVSGQLEIALEIRDVFAYLILSSLETPYYNLAYDRAFEPFIAAVNRTPRAEAETAHRLLEDHLLKVVPHMLAADHALGGQMADKEQEYTPIAAFSLRTKALERVEKALTGLASALATTSLAGEFQAGQLTELDRLADVDGHADLLALSHVFERLLSQRYQESGDARWRAALVWAQALQASLGYPASDVATAPVLINLPTAAGAWAHLEIDNLMKEAELSVCETLRRLTMLNQSIPGVFPVIIDPQGNRLPANGWLCEDRPLSHKLVPRPGIPISIDRMVNLRLKWPQGVPAQLLLQPNGKRRLSLWFGGQRGQPLEFRPVLSLPGASEIILEYISGDPLFYLRGAMRQGQLLHRETFPVVPYVSIVEPTPDGKPSGRPGLYIAEAHTSGTIYKHGLGIFLKRSFTWEFQRYLRGRAPIELNEPARYEYTLEAYLAGLEKAGQLPNPVYHNGDFYRLHRIARTGWANFLFGR